jgi:hypothetical protein
MGGEYSIDASNFGSTLSLETARKNCVSTRDHTLNLNEFNITKLHHQINIDPNNNALFITTSPPRNHSQLRKSIHNGRLISRTSPVCSTSLSVEMQETLLMMMMQLARRQGWPCSALLRLKPIGRPVCSLSRSPRRNSANLYSIAAIVEVHDSHRVCSIQTKPIAHLSHPFH